MENTLNGILIVQDDLQKIVNFSEKCLKAGIDESGIYATVYATDIYRLLSTKNISTIIIDSEFYNLSTAATLAKFSAEKGLQVLLVTSNRFKKTIRMIMDRNLRYINPNISYKDLGIILKPTINSAIQKVVHL